MHACGTLCVFVSIFHQEATRLITPDLTIFPWNEEAPARAQLPLALRTRCVLIKARSALPPAGRRMVVVRPASSYFTLSIRSLTCTRSLHHPLSYGPDDPFRGDRTAIPMISRDDRIPLLRPISASLDSVSLSILRLQPRYMFLRLTFRSSFES